MDKYTWIDIGSSFLPSEIIAAFLYAQLENAEQITEKRLEVWSHYYNELKIERPDYVIENVKEYFN